MLHIPLCLILPSTYMRAEYPCFFSKILICDFNKKLGQHFRKVMLIKILDTETNLVVVFGSPADGYNLSARFGLGLANSNSNLKVQTDSRIDESMVRLICAFWDGCIAVKQEAECYCFVSEILIRFVLLIDEQLLI